MKKISFTGLTVLFILISIHLSVAQTTNTYIDRFLKLRDRIHDPRSGYFSKDGAPYHSVETFMCEAPDQGHESTSEAYSFYIWLEAMYGRVKGDWSPLNNAWSVLEKQTIPTHAMQPVNANYVSKGSKATYAAEHALPQGYPSLLEPSVPVGTEPVSKELANIYGTPDIYGMHWLFDCDNFYGYGNMGDGVSTPSYINTFQRGPQESTWETVPHPSVEAFKWGGPAGFLDLFIKDNANAPSKQWRYTNAPDADARVVQAIYWASEWAKNQGLDPASTVHAAKASRMGDYLRLAMFDKYFKPLGVQDKNGAGASGYGSAHYLLSWYYAWGGPLDTTQSWAWRIGCSHSHFGYQNPLAAYVLSNNATLIPKSPNAKTDWQKSLGRQIEMYHWLQSKEGAIAGGCTNSWNGNYEKYPANVSTFYNMAYVDNPVYNDPGSNTWFGFQAWSVERLAEYYYLTNDAKAKTILDKWVGWVKTVVQLPADGSFKIPSEIAWTGQPDTWNPASPGSNAGLSVSVKSYGVDLGIAACLAKALTYYAAATKRYGTLDDNARSIAQQLLDRMWNNYWEGDAGKGLGVPEERKDFRRFDSLVYVPNGWTGKMPNGDIIKPGIKFIDIRTKYKSDPQYEVLTAALAAGRNYSATFHRFWAQTDIALANAEYGYFFPPSTNTYTITSSAGTGGTISPSGAVTINQGSNQTFVITAATGYKTNAVTIDGISVGAVNTYTFTNVTANHTITASFVAVPTLTITASAGTGGTITPAGNVAVSQGSSKTFTIAASAGYVINSVIIDGTSVGAVASYTFNNVTANHTITASFTTVPKYTINASAGTGGTITPVGAISVSQGSSQTFTIAASAGYAISAVTVDGLSVGTVASYTFTNVTANHAINAAFSTSTCNLLTKYGVPRNTALPTLANNSYSRSYVLGTGGPSFSNITNTTINWDLPNKGLWQFSMNTNNGIPSWWINYLPLIRQTFASVSPACTLTGTGISGLDGDYWVNVDGANFVMVAKSGAFALYFTNGAAPGGCPMKSSSETTTIAASTESNTFNYYPNPVDKNSMITLTIKNVVTTGAFYHITDMSGKVFMSGNLFAGANSVYLNSKIESGVYIIKVVNGDAMFKQKLIVK